MNDTPEFLTVPELADLLRIKERKVYDLAASGDVPCSRATGKLLFPAGDVRAWIEGKKSGSAGRQARPLVVLGSHDPLLEWALRQSECGLATFLDGSADGIARFTANEGVAAGLHIHDAETGDWNVVPVKRALMDQDAVLVSFAIRRRGLVTPPEAAERFKGMRDLVGTLVAARQEASGTNVLLQHLLEDARLLPEDLSFTEPMRSEQDAVLAVAEGQADVAFGLEAVARPFGLGFVPLIDEKFDILFDRRAYFDAPVQRLMAFCRGDRFKERALALGGYDISDLGGVRWNA
ncbi:MAG: helix-turn-helix transcriptional regulator [Silicimonas sp.]|nr:helix-turn-helix transcriptional regulator [Silicimonas sp.]